MIRGLSGIFFGKVILAFIKSSKNHYFYCLGSSTSRYLPEGNNEKCVQRCVYVHRVFTIALILILNIWKPNKHPTIKNQQIYVYTLINFCAVIWSQIILLWGCPVHYRTFGSIPDLSSLMSVTSPPAATRKNGCRHCQLFPSSKITPNKKPLSCRCMYLCMYI